VKTFWTEEGQKWRYRGRKGEGERERERRGAGERELLETSAVWDQGLPVLGVMGWGRLTAVLQILKPAGALL
jgi:hypothetical protein